ncbi:MAG: DUF3078 domain-containing protein [Bacteroidia bacterium]|nr:DUF3078 domain-containing protein [Bacteroidia bacterium]
MIRKSLNIICLAAALNFSGNVFAQDAQGAAAAAAQELSKAAEAAKEEAKPVYWTKSARVDFGFNQTSLNDWAAGGYNTVTLNTGLDANANYAKDLMSWNNRLQLQYGFLWSADKDNLLQKSNDLIYLESKWGYKTGKDSKWSYSASYDFRAQFSNTYSDYVQAEDKSWSGTLKSGYLAPAYTNIALGIDWVPSKWLSINFAPVTGGFTIVRIEDLRKQYGMILREPALDPAVMANYRSAKFQFGAQLKADMKFVINEVFNYETQLVIFTDYLDKPFTHNRVNWDNKITWQIAKYINLGFNTWLIYDPNVIILNNKDLTKHPEGTQRVQFKEFLSFNFTYTFKPRGQK